MYAPDKGTETRKKITDTSNDLSDSLKGKFNDYVDNLKDTYQGIKDDARNLVDEGAAKMNTFKGEAKNEANNFQ